MDQKGLVDEAVSIIVNVNEAHVPYPDHIVVHDDRPDCIDWVA